LAELDRRFGLCERISSITNDTFWNYTDISVALENAMNIKNILSNSAKSIINQAYGIDLISTLTIDTVKAIIGNALFEGNLSVLNSSMEAIYTLRYNVSNKAKDIINEVYSINLYSNLDANSVQKLQDSLLFQRDTLGISGRPYWYFNGNLSNPAFDRLNLLQETMEAVYDLKALNSSVRSILFQNLWC
jgi:hypothetical protein